MPAEDDPFMSNSLTYGFLPGNGIAPTGSFASFGFVTGESGKISFGFGEARQQGLTDVNLSNRNRSEEVAVRYDQEGSGWRFSLDAGSSLDSGGIFGSLTSGGLKMADQAATAWTSITGQIRLDAKWTAKGTATIAIAPGTTPQASLITSISPVVASSFAAGLSGRNLFRDSDVLLLSVSQPMRAEMGIATLATGIGRDWSTGGVIIGQAHAPLTPSGREIDFETGYGLQLGSWRAQANAGFALDADHTRGKNAVLSLFTLSRAL
jgi:hypothetical protein